MHEQALVEVPICLMVHRWWLTSTPYGVQMMVDFKACSWPEHLDATGTSLAAHFDDMNQEPVADVMSALAAQAGGTNNRPPVITFSHFLPHQVSHFISSYNLQSGVWRQLRLTRHPGLKAHVYESVFPMLVLSHG